MRFLSRATVAAVIAAALAASATADDTKLKVKVGDKFPAFTLPATHADAVKPGAKELSLADLKGKVAVIAFYPKALTGG